MMKKVLMMITAALILAAQSSNFSDCVPKAAEAAEKAKPVIIKVSMSGAPMATREKVYTEFLWPELEKRTKGQLKFDLYYAESLIKLKDGLVGVGKGLADIAPFVPAYTQQRTPFAHTVWLPYQCPEDVLAGYRGMVEAFELYPEVFGLGLKESNVVPFFPTFAGKFVIATRKPIRKMEDLKGLKLRGVGRTGEWLSKMGATISSIPYTEVYTAIDRKTIDGGQFYFGDICAYKISEVAKYITDPRSGYLCTSWYITNAGLWNKLPVDVKKAFQDIRPELFEKLSESDAREMSACIEECQKRGIEIVKLSPEEQTKWKQASLYLWKEYMKDIDERAEIRGYLKEKGLNGEKIVMKIDELVKKHSKEGAK